MTFVRTIQALTAAGFLNLAAASVGHATALPEDFAPCAEQWTDAAAFEMCGTLAVPVDHFAPNEQMIDLPVRWLASPNPSASERPPVLRLNGGPGSSNLSGSITRQALDEFNMLIVGFRGVDAGPDLTCPQVADAITGAHRILEDGIPRLREAITDCFTAMNAQGFAPRHISVAQTVHDFAWVQDALNIPRVHLIAGSFGTRLGLIYQEAFPEHVAHAAFFGANPPGHTIWRPADLDAVLTRIANLCAAPEVCRGSPDEMLAALRQRPDGMNFLGLPMDVDRARVVAFLTSYDASTVPLIADAFLQAHRGRTLGLYTLATSHDFALPSAGLHWGHFVLMAAQSDFNADENYCETLAATDDAPFGSPLSQLFWCAIPGKQIAVDDLQYRQLTTRDAPTLLVSGEIDVSAPYEQIAGGIVPFRPDSQHWIIPGAGHYNLYSTEMMTAAVTFLLDGTAAQPDYTVAPVLSPAMGIGGALVWASAGLLIALLSIVAGIVFGLRRLRAARAKRAA